MHHFIDFKSFRDARIRLIRPLTILVGPNGSGKSNALEGIEVLASIAAGDPLREITDLDREGALNVRGGLQGCPRYGTNGFTLGFSQWAVVRPICANAILGHGGTPARATNQGRVPLPWRHDALSRD